MNNIIIGGLEKILFQYLDSMNKCGMNVTRKMTEPYLPDFFKNKKTV